MKKQTKNPKQRSATWFEPKATKKIAKAIMTITFYEDDKFSMKYNSLSIEQKNTGTNIIGALETIKSGYVNEIINNNTP